MTNVDTHNHLKPNWKYVVVAVLSWQLFANLLDRIWQVPYVVSVGLFIPLFFLPLYWIAPQPKKVSFTKYLGILLVVTCLTLIVVGIILGFAKLLSFWVSRGWAYGLTLFAFFQCLYWVAYWGSPRNKKPVAHVIWLLLSLLIGGVPILLEYRHLSLLKSLR